MDQVRCYAGYGDDSDSDANYEHDEGAYAAGDTDRVATSFDDATAHERPKWHLFRLTQIFMLLGKCFERVIRWQALLGIMSSRTVRSGVDPTRRSHSPRPRQLGANFPN